MRRRSDEKERDGQQFERVLPQGGHSADNESDSENASRAYLESGDTIIAVYGMVGVSKSATVQRDDSIVLSMLSVIHLNRFGVSVMKSHWKRGSDCRRSPKRLKATARVDNEYEKVTYVERGSRSTGASACFQKNVKEVLPKSVSLSRA